jgi:diguanylate cyclase (GGDEF)-like protein
MHDALTGLPNRLLLADRIQSALSLAKRYQHLVALLVVDLDNFKTINDSFGHGAGDALLQYAATVFKKAVRDSDTVARFGGDEFVIVLTNLREIATIRTVMERMYAMTRMPRVFQEQELALSMSIGISIYPTNAKDQEQMFRHGDLAMYKAKSLGKNNYKFYLDELNS